MTASDFHKALRTLNEVQGDTAQFFSDEIAMQLKMERTLLLQHLHTLQTLGLVEFHDEHPEVFSLTESGKLANLH